MDIIGFILADSFYIISFIFYKKNLTRRGLYLLVLGLCFHTLSIAGHWLATGYPPFFSFYEILISFSWAIVFISLITGFHKVKGMFVALSAWIMLGAVCFLNPGTTRLPEELRTILFPVHVSSCLLGYGSFFISFICGILYLNTKRDEFLAPVPPHSPIRQNKAEAYKAVSCRAVIFGLIFFSLGIIIGSLWAKEAWGSYWSWDPKETAALIPWLIYVLWLCARSVFRWKEKYSAWLTIAGFCAMLFTWLGVNYFLQGLHSYK